MPKKAHGRQAKQRPRNRRPAPTVPSAPAGYEDEAMTAAPVAAPAASTVAAPRSTASPARSTPRGAASRRTPTITVNYAYLRRDLLSLAVLGPAMVVLLIVAYLVFHGA